MQILIPTSAGELLDKISILTIKKDKIKNPEKLKEINKESLELQKIAKKTLPKYSYDIWINQLIEINEKLWEIEDRIRIKESNNQFDSEFIGLARQVYIYNDKRFIVKNEINANTDSDIKEQKEYVEYNKI
jgi:hypothetical protein